MSDDTPVPPPVGQQHDVFPQIGDEAVDQEGVQNPRLGRAAERAGGLAEGQAVDSGAADDWPPEPPVDPGRRQADDLLTPDRTGGSASFARTAGGTLLAPDVEDEELEPRSGGSSA